MSNRTVPGDMPKCEMEEYAHQLALILGDDKYYSNKFRVHPGYDYEEGFLPHLAMLGVESKSELVELCQRTLEIKEG